MEGCYFCDGEVICRDCGRIQDEGEHECYYCGGEVICRECGRSQDQDVSKSSQ
jgi:rRNA maturation endonuclease Nob1